MSDDNDPDDSGPSDDDVREALHRLKTDDEEVGIGDVLTLYSRKLLPAIASDAIDAVYATRRDVNNGGMDQVAWNHGVEQTRAYATAWNAIGAIENARLCERLASALEAYHSAHDEAAIAADPVTHFIAFRKSVGGPAFSIPEPIGEVSEALLEYVLERASTLPDGP